MILVRLMGGLGNQMFQYAAARGVAFRNNTELKIDTRLLDDNRKREHSIYTHRDLDLGIFRAELQHATVREVEYFNGRQYPHIPGKIVNKIRQALRGNNLVVERSKSFEPSILKLGDNKCMVGSWQSEKYFEDICGLVKEDFKFKQTVLPVSGSLRDEILSVNAVCVNVRRGDYVTSRIYSRDIGALALSYFQKGISICLEKLDNPHFFIFSDDIEWCREHLRISAPASFVLHEHAGAKFGNYLQLMSACTHFLISNSTFSWWAAWLGEKKGSLVLAPSQWARNPVLIPGDILPPRWKKLDNDFESIR